MSSHTAVLSGPSSRWVHWVSATFVILLWGGSYAATRAAVQEFPPLLLAFLRFVLAATLFGPLVRARCRGVRLAPEDRWAAAGLGFTGVTLYFAFENLGLARTTASHGALIIATIPLATQLAEAVRSRRRPRLRVLLGLGTALAGVGLIVGADEGAGASLLGDGLMFGAVFAWLAYTFLAERLGRRYPNLWVTQAAMVGGAAFLAPLAAVEWLVAPAVGLPSPGAWAAFLYLAVLCSALGYLLWNAAIPALGVTAVNNLIYGIPLAGVASGVVFLGEPFTGRTVWGAALVLAGVYAATVTRGFKKGATGAVP
ncbi:MAG: DMT family transporter [Deltaproteobacteria bacterium]|nr:DMT family transporter [Deltaproteobacteria bacterium]